MRTRTVRTSLPPLMQASVALASRPSIPQGTAVLTRVGGAGQHSGVLVDAHDLRAAPGHAMRLHPMAELAQPRHHVGGHRLLDEHGVAVEEDAGGIDRL